MKLFGLSDRKCKSIFQDGCDYYGSDPAIKWTAGNGASVDLSGTNSRTGIGAIACQGVTAPQQGLPVYTVYFAGVAAKLQDLDFGGQPIMFYHDNDLQIKIAVSAAGEVVLSDQSGALAASAPNLVSANVYNYFELGANANTLLATVRLNGLTVLSDIPFSLNNATAFNLFRMSGQGGGLTMWVDDIYVNDDTIVSSTNPNNTFAGPVRLYPGVPISDSTPLQFTPSSGSAHWSLVDAVPPNGGVDYVFDNNPGDIDQYIFGEPTVPAGSKIVAFCVALLANIDTAGARVIASQIGANQGAPQALTTDYDIYSTQYDVNPITGNALLLADLPSMPCGPAVVS